MSIGVMRIPISLPCQVPVLPGTGDVDAPIERRTERCATDGFWMVGRAIICSEHLRVALGPFDEEMEALISEYERKPWANRRRYSQESATPSWDASA